MRCHEEIALDCMLLRDVEYWRVLLTSPEAKTNGQIALAVIEVSEYLNVADILGKERRIVEIEGNIRQLLGKDPG